MEPTITQTLIASLQYGFEPAPKENEKKALAKNDGKSLFERGVALFRREPVLGALCFEVFFAQAQSSLLNSLFVLKLKEGIPMDDERARYTGNVSHQYSVWFLRFLSVADLMAANCYYLYNVFSSATPLSMVSAECSSFSSFPFS
jgi:ATP/ADP translocase